MNDTAPAPAPLPPRVRAMRGFLTGFLLFALLGFVRALVVASEAESNRALVDGVVLALAAGVLFAIGKGICDQITGSVVGGVAGAFLGGLLGSVVPLSLGAVPLRSPPQMEEGPTFALAGPTLDG